MIVYSFIIAAVICILIFIGFFWKINWVQNINPQRIFKNNRKTGNLPPVYPNGWFGLLDSLSLKKRQVKHITALGQNFAVFRTEKGIARILDAYCPHLGANMAEGGKVIGEELECPFHCWRFCGESGKCTAMPFSKKVSQSIKTQVWNCLETNGIIFVWYHAELTPPEWYPQPIEGIVSGKWKYQGRYEFYVQCHIQDIGENGADWVHLEAIHTASMVNCGFFSKILRHSWSNVSWSPETTIQSDNDDKVKNKQSQKHLASIRLRHNMLLFNKYHFLELNVVAKQTGPSYVQIDLKSNFGTMYMVHYVTPIEPLLQKVTHLIFAPIWLAPYSKIIMIGEAVMFRRDIDVWNYKKFMDNPMLVNEDKNIKKYREWFKQFYTKNSPTYESCKESLEW